ncbi:MAG: hypothetical protein J4G13_07650 [Dehalococcoidia bacterium]|nr:hypothetical protein [Dehalococcoidia bacterium]
MDLQQLADELSRMYNTAPRGEQTTMIHMFGIKYASELTRTSPGSVIEQSGLHSSYVTEIHKGAGWQSTWN